MDIDNCNEDNQKGRSGAVNMGDEQSPHSPNTPFSIRKTLVSGLQNFNQKPFATFLLINGLLVIAVNLHLMGSSPHIGISTFLLCLGITIFLWGVANLLTKRALACNKRILERIASLLEVSTLQPLILITGLSLSLASRAAAGDGLYVFSPIARILWLL